MRQEASPDRTTVDLSRLRIIHYPDPRLRQRCQPVTEFGEPLLALVERMRALMETGKGVGLAASQLGVLQRIFIMNATGQPGDERVFVNPVLKEMHGSVEAEEGCLSLPGVNVRIRRAQRCRVEAQDVFGQPFTLDVQDLPARVCQHEYDHLNGVLLIDRMGPSDRLATRKILRALEEQYRSGEKRSR